MKLVFCLLALLSLSACRPADPALPPDMPFDLSLVEWTGVRFDRGAVRGDDWTIYGAGSDGQELILEARAPDSGVLCLFVRLPDGRWIGGAIDTWRPDNSNVWTVPLPPRGTTAVAMIFSKDGRTCTNPAEVLWPNDW